MTTAYAQMNLWQRINDRQSRAVTIRSPFDGARDRVVEIYRPDLTPMVDTKGQFYSSKTVVNGDPAYCGNVMNRGIVAGMASAAQQWRMFKPRQQDSADDNDMRRWCQQLDRIMLDVYSDRESTFYEAFSRHTHSRITVGSPVMIIEEHDGHIVYTVPHHQQAWLMRDYFGQILGLHLKYKMAAMEIEQEFPEHLLPTALKTALQSGNHFDEYELIQAFYRTKDPIFKDRPAGDVEIMRHRPWVCLWSLVSTDLDKEEPVKIAYYRSRPFVVGDWDLNPQETYSRTPAWHAIKDVLGGQQVWKSTLQLAQLKARPPIWSLKRLAGALDREPGGRTEVDERDWEKKPVPFGYEGDYLTSTDIWARVNQATERWFMLSFFLQFQMMIEQGKTPPTATQIIKADSQALAQIGGGIQGVERTLWSIDERVFEILYHAGVLPPPPDFVQRGTQEEGIDWFRRGFLPIFQGPLSQAQRVNATLQRLNIGLAACSPLFVLDDTAALKLKVPDMVERIMEEVGVWEDTLRSADEYEEVIQQMLERQERQAQVALGKTQADTVKALSGKTDPSSAMAAMTQ